MTVTRGTTNKNSRGSTADRAARRAFLVVAWQSNVPGLCRCYRCGVLLFNPDDGEPAESTWLYFDEPQPQPLTVDRIIPACKGGTYRRNNIRPACGLCNSETGGALRSTPTTRSKS